MSKRFKKHIHHEQNTAGRDFVVGDIHGCYEDLLKALTLLKFDGTVDRLFSVGDLVDRGPDSFKSAELVYEKWFFSVQGNHEEMMFEALLRKSQSHEATWLWNGGMWMHSHDREDLKHLCYMLEEQPLVRTVGEGDNKFHVVHAELLHNDWSKQPTHVPLTDDMIDNWVFSSGEEDTMRWGRTLITQKNDLSRMKPGYFVQDMEKMSLTFVGHTPVTNVVQVQKQMYIDTGAVYFHMNKNKSEQHRLTLACPTEQKLYHYNMMWKTLTTTTFADVPKYG